MEFKMQISIKERSGNFFQSSKEAPNPQLPRQGLLFTGNPKLNLYRSYRSRAL